MYPALRVVRIVLRPPYRRASDVLGEVAVRVQLVVQRGVLACARSLATHACGANEYD